MNFTGISNELQQLDQKCYEVLKKGHRPGTRRNKKSQMNLYSKFCEEYGLQEFPADEWQLIRYMAYTAEHVTCKGTVSNYVGGVISLQKLAGYEVPAPTSPNFKLMIQGLKDELKNPVLQATPVTKELLAQISVFVNRDDGYELCSYSAILTGFFLFLRPSNLVPESHPKFNGQEQLTRGHVALDHELLRLAMVHIEWSKTIQHKEKELWLPVSPDTNKDICPVRHLKLLFDKVPASDTDPCFCYLNKRNVRKALTYKKLSKQLQDWVEKTGRDKERYTLQGLRRGGTTHGFNVGLSQEYIRLMGNWASDCFLRYIEINMDKRLYAAVKFANSK